MSLRPFNSIRVAMPALACILSLPMAAGDDTDVYRFDIGAGAGMSGYLGDANSSNLFGHPGFSGNIQGRYIFNDRTAVRAQFTGMSLSGNTADYDNKLPSDAQYSFRSWATALDLRGEFNFLPYGIGETYRQLRRVSPFVAGGVGVTVSGCDGKTYTAFSIPMSFGVKYKPSKRVNLIGEFTMAKVFGDHLDGEQLTDLTGIKSSFIKNTDWYSTISVSVTYEFGPRCVACNRID